MGTFSWFLLIHHFREDCRLFLCAETRHTSDFVAVSVRRATPVDRLHSPLPPPFSSRRWELDRLFPVGVRWRSAPRHLVIERPAHRKSEHNQNGAPMAQQFKSDPAS